MSRPVLLRRALPLALLAAIAAPAAHAEVAIDVIANSEISMEGLIQADFNWFDSDIANLNGDSPDGKDSDQELRRAEFVLKGKGPDNIEWVLGYDAKADRWLDVNIKYKLGGDANHFVQVGQYKQPNSLEELTSTRHNDFISKATVTNTFGIARRLGVAYRYATNDWGVTASYFGRHLTRGTPIVAEAGLNRALGSSEHGAGFGIRGNWAPINTTGNILHFGLSYINADTSNDVVRIRARPNADLAGVRLVDTNVLRNTDRQTTVGGEAMWVTGPFKLQGEYMVANVERYDVPNPLQSDDLSGNSWYVSGLWNITGETWGYKDGLPTTPLPSEPGKGMFQLGLRYDRLDLDDGSFRPGATPTAAPIVDGVLGGEMSAITAGINWYWRSNFKFVFNYVMVDSSRLIGRTSSTFSLDPANNNRLVNGILDDSPNIFEARLQFYF